MRITFIVILLLFSILDCKAQQMTDSDIEIELNNLHFKINAVRDSVNKLMKVCNEEIKKTSDLKKRGSLAIYEDSLYNVSDRNDIEELKINLNYAKQHPSSLYCLKLVQQQISRQPGKDFYDDFEAIYNNASPEVKQSSYGIKMSEQLIYFKQSKVGSIAPIFLGKDMNGKELTLEDYKGKKYVLIDFWASWCGPCRGELPYIKDLYEKYKDLGFEIVSVSRDTDLDNWRTAILKEGIQNWKHFSVIENNCTVEKNYFVNGIPHKVLIDTNGTIIGKWKGSGELNRKSLENQLKHIFNR
ncbi:TlpA disulfide reductase family protein [Flavobacterium sp.]|uniref:TlpA family protein disulfide reductase n=1 Tax=Flavobacterium sp. TaxID=239 RepID=UPI002BCAD892|nr:TlpA disulfide reductase family protein [Flavobacterium sp.]HSD08919.1 TlpA disulfide reductase family protein [Flavobacterium sp.]